MKKLMILCIVSALCYSALSQGNSLPKKSDKDIIFTNKMEKEYVTMKNGLALHVKDGNTTTLSSPFKLNNGSLVMPDGTIQLSDGTTKKLKEGEYIDIDGQMGKIKK
jgi:hypothetical protein